MPWIFLIIFRHVPVVNEKKCLNEGDPINIPVKVIEQLWLPISTRSESQLSSNRTYLDLLIEVAASRSPIFVACFLKELEIHIGCPRKHHCLIQYQTDGRGGVFAVDSGKKILEIHDRQIGVDIENKTSDQLIAELDAGQAQCSAAPEKIQVIWLYVLSRPANVRWKIKSGRRGTETRWGPCPAIEAVAAKAGSGCNGNRAPELRVSHHGAWRSVF